MSASSNAPKPENIGALWMQTSKAGRTYFKGKLGDRPIVIFPNQYKREGDKKPDFLIYDDKPAAAVTVEPPVPIEDTDLEF